MIKLAKLIGAMIILFVFVSFAGAQLTFTSIAVPGAKVTSIQGINGSGDMVGYYGKTNQGPFRSFLIKAGKFTPFAFPGASTTIATDINDSGLISGYVGKTNVRGFTYDGTRYTSFRDGSNTATFAFGINNAGAIVGGTGSIYSTTGYVLLNRSFASIAPPGSYVYVYATGINDLGEIVGWTDHDAFVYQGGQFQTIDFPGASMTEAWGVNAGGTIVGWYLSPDCTCGFALMNGHFISFSYPGAKGTFPRGTNALGQIVGEYTMDYNTYRGFVTSPLTPSR
jgi:uncharacterized membrane protein